MKMKNINISPKAKKALVACALVGTLAATVVGCGNKAAFDIQYTFNKIIIVNGDVATIAEVERWDDYEGEQLQIKTKDGFVFLVNSDNVYPVDDRYTDIEIEYMARCLVGENGEVNYLTEEAYNKSK